MNKHNGRNMVTMKEAGYLGSDDSVLNDIRNRYLNMKKTICNSWKYIGICRAAHSTDPDLR